MPIVGMAMIGEQPDNLARAVDRGCGLTVSVTKLDTLAQDLEQALRRLLTEPNFSANASRISHIMRAHRLTPVEKAAGKAGYHDISKVIFREVSQGLVKYGIRCFDIGLTQVKLPDLMPCLLRACHSLHAFFCNQAVWHAREVTS